MRIFIIAITSTVAGLAALFAFKTPGMAPTSAAASGGSSYQDQVNAVIRQLEPDVPIGPATGLTAGERTVDSAVEQTMYGPVQIQLVESGTTIKGVRVLVQPQTGQHDLQIGEVAFPKLISETLTAQNARIDSVSGATYTSGGYIKSLQSILDKQM